MCFVLLSELIVQHSPVDFVMKIQCVSYKAGITFQTLCRWAFGSYVESYSVGCTELAQCITSELSRSTLCGDDFMSVQCCPSHRGLFEVPAETCAAPHCSFPSELRRQHAFFHEEEREMETMYGTNKILPSDCSQANKTLGNMNAKSSSSHFAFRIKWLWFIVQSNLATANHTKQKFAKTG